MSQNNLSTSRPSNNEAKFDAKAVNELLLDGDLAGDREYHVAYSAWLNSYAARKTRQLGALTIPAAVFGLIAAIASHKSAPFWLAVAGLIVVVLVGAALVWITYKGRTIEAVEAASAVHKLRIDHPVVSNTDKQASGAASSSQQQAGATTPSPATSNTGGS